MNKIIFIADFFADQINGGGELNNEELISLLNKTKNFYNEILKINSHDVSVEFLKKNKKSFFIVSNFVNLNFYCREWLAESANYIIYEHDHKYLSSRNPAVYKNFKAPAAEIRNYSFYKNAKKIICQTEYHKNILQKNTNLNNIYSVGGNLWSLESLDKIRQFSKKEKASKCSILDSNIPHKNTNKAINYCKSENLEYELISDNNYINFLDKLSNNKKLVFFPGTPETLSRIVCEARMMGMSVTTNDLVGATHEEWFGLKGEELIYFMLNKRKEVVGLINTLYNENFNREPKKEISIISTFHDGSKFLEKFLEDITSQTIFDKCELILIDANSQHGEEEIIKKFMNKHDNIFYYRLEEKLLPTPCFNMAIKKSTGKYITFGFIDDRKRKDCIELLYREIKDSEFDLVYGDVIQTEVENETYEKNSSTGERFEHSTYPFSSENMVKCLPGPMPLWKRSIHDKCGFFDDVNCNFADDWDMWLRAVKSGSQFKKLDETVGLYLTGGRSQQNENLEQRREEAKIFFKYSNLFGYNYRKYEPYFRQYL